MTVPSSRPRPPSQSRLYSDETGDDLTLWENFNSLVGIFAEQFKIWKSGDIKVKNGVDILSTGTKLTFGGHTPPPAPKGGGQRTDKR